MQRIRENEVIDKKVHPNSMIERPSNVKINELEMSEDYMIPVKGKSRMSNMNSMDFAPVGISDQVQYDPTQDFAIFGKGDPT